MTDDTATKITAYLASRPALTRGLAKQLDETPGACSDPGLVGCTDPDAVNYDPLARVEAEPSACVARVCRGAWTHAILEQT
jgi:hypothetical protein